ncbi:MAG: ABC transporter ATP-binding protein [Alphaproteobacteria bacterium]|nr:MAG: ABC transporter ATP-binding protein [Alphaproteobacteria bacterium]
MTLLTVKDLSVTFRVPDQQPVEAVKKVSFTVEKGKTTALVGESGSGKSVTALSILQLLPYPMASHPSGEIVFDGQNVIGASKSVLRGIRGNRISMIFQEPMTALNPLHTIERQIAEPLFLHKKLSETAARARVQELLEMVGLSQLKTRLGAFPHELSGGQRQRVMIAMALANEPDILIADEPTTALDVTVQLQILELLQKLQKELDMAILLITHDLNVVRKMSDHVCVMNRGEIVEQGETKTVFETPEHAYTKALLSAEPKGAPPSVNDNARVLLTAEDVKVYFPIKKGVMRRTVDYVRAVDGIDMVLREGQTLGIVGESGSGKSTLGFAILRLLQAQGKISFNGQDVTHLSQKEMRPLRADMQLVFQDPYGALSPRLSVRGIIEEGLLVHQKNLSQKERDERVVDILKEVGLDPETRFRYPHEFSGGQRQRIAIARAMILNPKLVVLDEPTSALDMSVQAQIVELLRDLQKRHNLSYIFISHDLKVVRAMSHHVLVMQHGKIVEIGSREQIFENPETDYTKELLQAAFFTDAPKTAVPKKKKK